MTEANARAMIHAHFEASNIGGAGGAPGDDIARASEIYADDAVVAPINSERRLSSPAARYASPLVVAQDEDGWTMYTHRKENRQRPPG